MARRLIVGLFVGREKEKGETEIEKEERILAGENRRESEREEEKQ